MGKIQYVNDKTRVYLYDILEKQRGLTRREKKDYKKLRLVRAWNVQERDKILYDLKYKGYIIQPNRSLIERTTGGRELHGSLGLTRLEVTEAGEEFLKKELKSEYHEERHRIYMEWMDRLIDFKTIIFSILSAIIGWFIRDLFSLIGIER